MPTVLLCVVIVACFWFGCLPALRGFMDLLWPDTQRLARERWNTTVAPAIKATDDLMMQSINRMRQRLGMHEV